MTPLRAAWPAVAAALLAGCAAPQTVPAPVAAMPSDPAAAPGPAAATASTAPSGIDGLYRGSSTRYQAGRRNCPHPGLVALLVQGGQFSYRWDSSTDVPGWIGPDGSVTGQAGGVAMSGRLNGEDLQGDLTNGVCALHFTTHRRFSAT